MNGLGNVIRGPVIMTPLITDNYCSYRTRGVISIGPSRAIREEEKERECSERERERECTNDCASITGKGAA